MSASAVAAVNLPSFPVVADRNAGVRKTTSKAMAREAARQKALHALVQGFTPAGLVAVVGSTTANITDVHEHLGACPQCGDKFSAAVRARYPLQEQRKASVHAVHELGLYLYRFYEGTQVPKSQVV
jgi:hypothetical protein